MRVFGFFQGLGSSVFGLVAVVAATSVGLAVMLAVAFSVLTDNGANAPPVDAAAHNQSDIVAPASGVSTHVSEVLSDWEYSGLGEFVQLASDTVTEVEYAPYSIAGSGQTLLSAAAGSILTTGQAIVIDSVLAGHIAVVGLTGYHATPGHRPLEDNAKAALTVLNDYSNKYASTSVGVVLSATASATIGWLVLSAKPGRPTTTARLITDPTWQRNGVSSPTATPLLI